ncbi:MAG: CRISPR-associated endonuclease Cas2 [Mycobacterium sp.]|nr:CRISPR-associated endonuclease Cas2 [Mycobacterium sp.]
MAHYIVTYDLSAPGRDYKRLFDYLKQYAYAKPVESVWVVETSKNAETLRDEMEAHVDNNDKIFIIRGSTADWATRNVAKPVTDWLYEHAEAA